MKLNRLRLGEWIATVGAVALAIFSFLPWFQGPDGNLTAWDSFGVVDVLIILVVVSALTLTVTTLTERTTALPVASAVWTTLFAIVAFVGILLRVLIKPSGATGHCAGSWLALLASALIVIGAWLSMRDDRIGRYEPDHTPSRAAPPA